MKEADYGVDGFDEKKTIVLSYANMFGGKNEILSFMYIGFGAANIVVALLMLLRKCTRKKRAYDVPN